MGHLNCHYLISELKFITNKYNDNFHASHYLISELKFITNKYNDNFHAI